MNGDRNEVVISLPYSETSVIDFFLGLKQRCRSRRIPSRSLSSTYLVSVSNRVC